MHGPMAKRFEKGIQSKNSKYRNASRVVTNTQHCQSTIMIGMKPKKRFAFRLVLLVNIKSKPNVIPIIKEITLMYTAIWNTRFFKEFIRFNNICLR